MTELHRVHVRDPSLLGLGLGIAGLIAKLDALLAEHVPEIVGPATRPAGELDFVVLGLIALRDRLMFELEQTPRPAASAVAGSAFGDSFLR